MDRLFTHQNVSFAYRLLLEERKTISATVFPTQDVLVRAPREATNGGIDDFLRRRLRWVVRQRRYFAQFKLQPEPRCVSGESFKYRGRSYKLLIRKAADRERVVLQHGTLVVHVGSSRDRERVRHLLEAWYRRKAREALSERFNACLALFGYRDPPSLVVRRMSRRWGSYVQKTRKVILNQDLIKASTRHMDYVIIHELCHVTHPEHSRAFYDLLGSIQPNQKRLKMELELGLLG